MPVTVAMPKKRLSLINAGCPVEGDDLFDEDVAQLRGTGVPLRRQSHVGRGMNDRRVTMSTAISVDGGCVPIDQLVVVMIIILLAHRPVMPVRANKAHDPMRVIHPRPPAVERRSHS